MSLVWFILTYIRYLMQTVSIHVYFGRRNRIQNVWHRIGVVDVLNAELVSLPR